MTTFRSVVLGSHFDDFLPGFRLMEYLAIILFASLVASGHADAPFIVIILGGAAGACFIPRLFLFLAKHGMLGKNWDEKGLTKRLL